jgi:hypothetical protein
MKFKYRLFLLFYTVFLGLLSTSNAQNSDSNLFVTLEAKNISLRKALKQIGEQIDIYFLYDDAIIDGKKVSCQFSSEPIEKCFYILFKPFKIQYKTINQKTFLLFQNDERTIHGFIFDASTNTPLPHANVFVEGTTLGITTGSNGKFSLTIPINSEVLIIQYMGYKTQNINLFKSADGMHIPLNPIAIPMQPVVASASSINELDVRVNSSVSHNEQTNGLGYMSNLIQTPVLKLPFVREETVIEGVPGTKDYKKYVYNPVQMLNSSESPHLTAQNQIRQGHYNEDLFIVDGIRLFEPYHMKIIPGINSGIYSQEMLKQSQYYNGGFNVNYGNAVNSLLNIEYGNETNRKFSSKASAGFLGQDVYLSSGRFNTYSFMIHAKRNDDNNLPNLLKTDREFSPKYNDIQMKFKYFFSPKNQIEMYLLQSEDDCKSSPGNLQYSIWNAMNVYQSFQKGLDHVDEYRSEHSDYQMQIASLRTYHQFQSSALNFRFSYLKNRANEKSFVEHQITTEFQREPRLVSIISKNETFNKNLIKETLESESVFSNNSPDDRWKNSFGIQYQAIRYYVSETSNAPMTWQTNLFKEDTIGSFYQQHPIQTYFYNNQYRTSYTINTNKLALFLSSRVYLEKYVVLNLGIRGDYFQFNKEFSLNPRIKLNWFLSKNILLGAAWGIYSQIPTMYQMDQNNKIHNQTAFHYIGYFDIQLSSNHFLKIETFYKKFKGLIPISRMGNGALAYLDKSNSYIGYSSGIHLSSSYKRNLLKIQCDYTYKKSMEKHPKERSYFPRYNDQRHTFSTNVSYIVWKEIKLSLINYIGSGYSYTPFYLTNDFGILKWQVDSHNSSHFPTYHRMDVEIVKSFKINKLVGSLDLFVKLINITNRKNVFAFSYSYDRVGNPLKENQILYGFIPLAGVRYSF